MTSKKMLHEYVQIDNAEQMKSNLDQVNSTLLEGATFTRTLRALEREKSSAFTATRAAVRDLVSSIRQLDSFFYQQPQQAPAPRKARPKRSAAKRKKGKRH